MSNDAIEFCFLVNHFHALFFYLLKKAAHFQATGMIGTATPADDQEVLVILRSMKSAVSDLVEDKKNLSA